jgi:cell division protein FtsL
MLPDLPGWDSLPAVTRFHNWAEMAGIIVVALLVVTEVVAYKYGHRKDDLTEQQQTATNQRHDDEMARLHLETAQITKEAETARAAIANANAQAAQARLEQERLKAELAWRTLSPQVVAQLEQILSKHPGKINVQHVANDTEALYLAIQLANIFGKAKWEVQMLSVTMGGALVFGLWSPNAPSSDTAIVRDALRAVNIGFSTDTLPPQGMAFGGTIPDAPILFVGSKPIPQ